MPLFISNSKGRIPLLPVALLLLGLITWLFGAVYTVRWNPEVRYYVETHGIKSQWLEQHPPAQGPRCLVFGGSSCETSIVGELLLDEFGIPTANLGRAAGMGAVVLTMAALQEARPGDWLVMSIEPGLLTGPLSIPSLGIQFSLAARQPEWVLSPLDGAVPVSWIECVTALRPGGRHALAFTAKRILGRDSFPYHAQDMSPSGWNRVTRHQAIVGPPGHNIHLSEDSRKFLSALRTWTENAHIQLMYALPWAYCPRDQADGFRERNREFLREISAFMPVLKDETWGAIEVVDSFTDTAWHLNEEAARRRTRTLGRNLALRDFWSSGELAGQASH